MRILSALLTDAYKAFHPSAYHPDTKFVYSNYTNRFDSHSNTKQYGKKVVNAGVGGFLQRILIEHWNENFFDLPVDYVEEEYKRVIAAMKGTTPDQIDAQHIVDLWHLNYLPLRIKALPEGALVDYGVPTITIESTVDGFGWVTNLIETVMSSHIWPVTTAATTAYYYRKAFEENSKITGLDKGMIPFLGHDFSFRGLVGIDDPMLTGFGHLTSFVGSDTFPAALYAESYYNAPIDEDLVFSSVDATEHSVMCSYGSEGEKSSLEHLMTNVCPTGILSVVSDTWDFWKLVTEYLPELKDKIMARDGTLVIRPDSGDPVKILTGYKTYDDETMGSADLGDLWNDGYRAVQYCTIIYPIEVKQQGGERVACLGKEISQAEKKGLVECLWDTFGGTVNEKGYKLLDSHIGAIYGDSITLERQKQILSRLTEKGFVPQVVLGIGSFTYHYVTRDTHGTAVKATCMSKGGDDYIPMQKSPKTDMKKKSASGFMRVELENGEYVVYDNQTYAESEQGELEEVFYNGVLTTSPSLATIRERINNTFN